MYCMAETEGGDRHNIECRRCGEEEHGGEHRVFWCRGVMRPTWGKGGTEGVGEWTLWEEVVEEWAAKKQLGKGVMKFSGEVALRHRILRL